MNEHHRRLASADHAWLRMDTPQNLVVIHLAFCFDAPLPLQQLVARLRARLTRHHQFTHRIERRWNGARWIADEHFSMARHLQELRLQPGAGRAELQAWMGAQAGVPLPEDRPLWQAALVHGVDGGSALVMRVHHSLADGISLMGLIANLTEVADGEIGLSPARAAEREPLRLTTLLQRAPRVVADAVQMLFMRRDRASKLKGTPGIEKSVSWSAPISLALARDLGARHGATVNDVMLSVIADVLRRHLQSRGVATIEAPLRAVVPMNMRAHADAHLLGNRFGLVGVELPVHLDDPLQRLQWVRDAMTGLKRGLQGQLALALVRFAGWLPHRAQHALLGVFSRRATVIVTNVIGPAETRAIAGARMRELMLCVPQGMTVGVGLSIISYNGELRIGFLADRSLMPDGAAAAASVRACFEQLRRAACTPPQFEPGGVEEAWAPPMAAAGEVCVP
jgi:WS/DGAT/MGAT family acyltransferase